MTTPIYSYFNLVSKGNRPFSDFDWFAVDAAGSLGIFSTVGQGLVPKAVFSDEEKYHLLQGFFEKRDCTSEVYPGNLLSTSEKKDMDGLILSYYAKRGLHCFEYSMGSSPPNVVRGIGLTKSSYDYWYPPMDLKIPYRKMLGPSSPVFLEDLPVECHSYLKSFCFDSASFSSEDKILPSDHFPELI